MLLMVISIGFIFWLGCSRRDFHYWGIKVKPQNIFWIGRIYAGSFSAMQTAVVIAGLPFSGVILLYMVSLYRDLARC